MFGKNFRYHDIIPKNRRKVAILADAGISKIALIFLESILNPSRCVLSIGGWVGRSGISPC